MSNLRQNLQALKKRRESLMEINWTPKKVEEATFLKAKPDIEQPVLSPSIFDKGFLVENKENGECPNCSPMEAYEKVCGDLENAERYEKFLNIVLKELRDVKQELAFMHSFVQNLDDKYKCVK